MDPIQTAKVTNYLVKKLGAGEYASAYLSLPRSIADTIISDYSSGHQSKAATLAKLRANLQVTKISSQRAADQNSTDIDQEVEILAYLQRIHRHPNIVELMNADTTTDERKRWYTMRPICRGGNIEQLCHEDFQGQLPAGLVWHIACQLVSVLLYLHFGSYEASTEAKTDWPLITHGDINPGNLLFHFPSAASPARTGNYPNLILIDFGKSTFIQNQKKPAPSSPGASKPSTNPSTPTKPTSTTSPPPPSSPPLTKSLQTVRTGDLSNTLYWLTSLEQSLSNDDSVQDSDGDDSSSDDDEQDDTENQDGPYGRALKGLEGLEKKSPRDLYRALREFQKFAAEMRGKLYKDLDGELLEFFGSGQEDVTDEELESVFPVLKR